MTLHPNNLERKRLILTLGFWWISVVGMVTASASEELSFWKRYEQTPMSWDASEAEIATEVIKRGLKLGVKSILYEGPEYQGKKTKVFAYYGIPEEAKRPEGGRVPGIILVHGGGGTAFETWVKQWVDRGYAALAMDTCGAYPLGNHPQRPFSNEWARLKDGGPAGWGGFEQSAAGIDDTDHWMHQATAAVMLGHSWLLSQPEVAPLKTGVTGISWGAVLACRVIGADSRFQFAVPVYGSGFLHESSTWKDGPLQDGNPLVQTWGRKYDPSVLLAHTKVPILWLNGTNDFAFPLDSWLKSSRIVRGPSYRSMLLRMPHGHGGAGEDPEIIHAFANQHVLEGSPLAEVQEVAVEGHLARVQWRVKNPEVSRVVKASLIFTKDEKSPWKDRLWEELPLGSIDAEQTSLSHAIPDGAKFWYFQLTDDRGLAISAFPD